MQARRTVGGGWYWIVVVRSKGWWTCSGGVHQIGHQRCPPALYPRLVCTEEQVRMGEWLRAGGYGEPRFKGRREGVVAWEGGVEGK